MEMIKEYLEKLTELLVNYTPAATELLLNVARIRAASEVIPSFIILLFFIVTYKIVKVALRKHYKEHPEIWDDHSYMACHIVSSVLLFLGIILCSHNILDVWAWCGIFYPELYLANEAIEALK